MLNSRERAQLRAIETALWLQDPAFCRLLTTGRVRSAAPRRFALALLVLGVVGLLLAMTVLSTLGVAVSVVLALVGGGLWLWFSGAVTPGR
ncbi:DUF3040 domain-containing protein [Pseudonocardia oroxyli]|uniref:DUF3040 domain-containing protein n=1 Tax=Pseudonocardia oroxyli TaxID=366584 RepID=A0A1G8ANB2_PSEOR|nr:DUF3040 domain-containing protein [Pseudonocardia oroxyli]SDH22404.1 Protein of unknown function [Pseudonocardia oroxyli]